MCEKMSRVHKTTSFCLEKSVGFNRSIYLPQCENIKQNIKNGCHEWYQLWFGNSRKVYLLVTGEKSKVLSETLNGIKFFVHEKIWFQNMYDLIN